MMFCNYLFDFVPWRASITSCGPARQLPEAGQNLPQPKSTRHQNKAKKAAREAKRPIKTITKLDDVNAWELNWLKWLQMFFEKDEPK